MPSGDRRGKFVELAEKRVANAIRDIRLLGNLSNRTNYSYTREDFIQIISALQAEIRKLKKKFESSVDTGDVVVFRLKSLNPNSDKLPTERSEIHT